MTERRSEALAIEEISAGYGARRVLDGVTLPPLRAGTVTALVGPNGAGKSTLLRAVAGLLPARGAARLGAIDLLRLSAVEHANHVAFMPQTLPQRVRLSVFETLLSAMNAATAGPWLTTSRGAQQRAVAMLERVGIADRAHRAIDQLSGGERQLASLACTLVRNPHVLLLDEPTSALDLGHQVSVMSLVRELATEGRIVLVVSHDLNLAVRWADQVVVLRDGRVDAFGAPIDALTPVVLARTYGVAVRIERCSRGHVQILVDGLAEPVGMERGA